MTSSTACTNATRIFAKQVHEAEEGLRPMDDMTLHSLKREKLKAKDRLFFLWEHRS